MYSIEPTHDDEPRGLAGAGRRVLQLHGLAVMIGWIIALVGGLLAVIGYVSVSGTSDVSSQVSRLASTSVAGLALVGIGGALVLTSHYRRTVDALLDLRDEVLDESAPAAREEAVG